MVETGPDDYIRITGILDWDSALFAPKFVSCRPPWWLWQDELFPEDAMKSEKNANIKPYDPELLEVKNIFEEIVGNEYNRFAYQPQYLLSRRLFDIALYGVHSNEDAIEVQEIVKEWSKLDKELMDDYTCSNSDSAA